MDRQAEMKRRVAGTVKWNAIDKILSMALYTVTGIVLAREVPKDDFGLLGAVMVFASFAALFVDSGFSSALIQKKRVSRLDYSSVFWLNMAVATAIYVLLYFFAPLIARIFQNDLRIIPVARVAFLAFVINATAIVQTNRLMKRMQVKMITVSNALGLIISSVAAIWMAVEGMGVWALVWQTLILAAVKSIVLWTTGRWTPLLRVSFRSLKSFFKVGSGMMGGAFLNILFKNIYAFIIGMRAGVLPLSYYTQADKWSNMGISSLTAIFTQSFLPALSQFQDDPKRFASSTAKMNRFTSYLLFPCCGLAIIITTALFHLCFGPKWDAAIYLFQLLMLRGIFTVLSSLYNNYLLALGRARLIVVTELIRDSAALIAIALTWPYITLETADDPTLGIAILLWGQIGASVLTWAITLVIAARLSGRTSWQFVCDSLPYAATALISVTIAAMLTWLTGSPLILVIGQLAIGTIIYMGLNRIAGSRIQSEVIDHFRSRFMR